MGASRQFVVTAPTANHFYFPLDGISTNTETAASSDCAAPSLPFGAFATPKTALDAILLTKSNTSAGTLGLCLHATTNSPSVTISLPTPVSTAVSFPYPIPLGGLKGIDADNFALSPSHANIEFVCFYRKVGLDADI